MKAVVPRGAAEAHEFIVQQRNVGKVVLFPS